MIDGGYLANFGLVVTGAALVVVLVGGLLYRRWKNGCNGYIK